MVQLNDIDHILTINDLRFESNLKHTIKPRSFTNSHQTLPVWRVDHANLFALCDESKTLDNLDSYTTQSKKTKNIMFKKI